jgi:hypothetical protein
MEEQRGEFRTSLLVVPLDEIIELTLESQIREKVLGSSAVKEAKEELDVLVWNTFLAGFGKEM